MCLNISRASSTTLLACSFKLDNFRYQQGQIQDLLIGGSTLQREFDLLIYLIIYEFFTDFFLKILYEPEIIFRTPSESPLISMTILQCFIIKI